jgi:hypothetical protein
MFHGYNLIIMRLKFALLLNAIIFCGMTHATDQQREMVSFSYYSFVPELRPFQGPGFRYLIVKSQSEFNKHFHILHPGKIDWKRHFLITIYHENDKNQTEDIRLHVVRVSKHVDKLKKPVFHFTLTKKKVFEPESGEGLSDLIPKVKIPQITLLMNHPYPTGVRVEVDLMREQAKN